MLPIWRRVGAGFYMGRAVRVTVTEVREESVRLAIEAPVALAVSGPDTKPDAHVQRQNDREGNATTATATETDITTHILKRTQAVHIGRGVRIEFVGCDKPMQATLNVQAPRSWAVTRDEFTIEQHMAMQEKRERGTQPVPPSDGLSEA